MNFKSREICSGKKTAEFLTEIFLSVKIIRKPKKFPVLSEILPVFAVFTLLPEWKKDTLLWVSE